VWGNADHTRVLQVIHNPRYAGAFCYGRIRFHRKPDGRVASEKLPRDQWHTLLPGAHPGYLSWEEYEENQRRLLKNAQAYGAERRKSPPREGPALLQGLAVCGRCGRRMTVRYHTRNGRTVPEYCCQAVSVEKAGPHCQDIP
jgi:hypothetical protein